MIRIIYEIILVLAYVYPPILMNTVTQMIESAKLVSILVAAANGTEKLSNA